MTSNLKEKNKRKTIGRLEKVSFPEIGLLNIDAKIDTGAFTSSIHCISIEEKLVDSKKVIIVQFSKKTNHNKSILSAEFTNFSKVRVRSSSGRLEKRFKIKTKIKLGNKIYVVSLTLSNRSKMKYPVLIGRKLLNNRYLVDVSRKNLLNS